MKIGIDVSQAVFAGTGVATYTRQLVKHMIEADHEYVLFGSSFGRFHKLRTFLQTYKRRNTILKPYALPPAFWDMLWNRFHAFAFEQVAGTVDVYHSSDWAQAPSRARKVTTIHDLVVFAYPQHLHPGIVSVQKRRLSWVARECDAIIADSESTKQDIVRFLNVDDKKIHVVHLGVDDRFFPQKDSVITHIKQKYGITGAYILSVGTIEPRKNIRRVIKAFEKLRKTIDQQLVIVGNIGWGEEVDAGAGVVQLGFVPTGDLPALYTGASCFVYPSLYEGFGLPVLEAMACGCPVVISDKGSLAEIAGDSLIADPQDADNIAAKIHQILTLSDRKYADMVQKGLCHARQFTWEETAKKTVHVYSEVLG